MSGFGSAVGQATSEWFHALGYDYRNGADLAPDGAMPDRPTDGQFAHAGVEVGNRHRRREPRVTLVA